MRRTMSTKVNLKILTTIPFGPPGAPCIYSDQAADWTTKGSSFNSRQGKDKYFSSPKNPDWL